MKKLEEVISTIKNTASDAGFRPGVYKMIDCSGKVIYVGKAKNLQKRLLSYANFEKLSNRIKMMVLNISRIEFIVVNSEVEALLLEGNLIKTLLPRYNVLFKDDKTFPYIVIGSGHEFPRIFKYRTLKPRENDFFGPYPFGGALDETIKIIQKIFLLRICTDSYFASRDRPCLQYFINRCSAPCVGKISKESYAENVKLAKALLLGNDNAIREALISQMNVAAKGKKFEKAALIRDQIKAIADISSRQYIQIEDLRATDFITAAVTSDFTIVAVAFFRAGKNVGIETFEMEPAENAASAIEVFIIQFYRSVMPPKEIITGYKLKHQEQVTKLLNTDRKEKTRISFCRHYVHKKIIETCEVNAKMKLRSKKFNQYDSPLRELCTMLNIDKINRIETFDNSHLQGTNACGVMVVFEDGALQKNGIRKFNIDSKIAHGGDDINMMKFALEKRFNSKNIPIIPDLLMIDGGWTQVAAAMEVIKKFGLIDRVKVIGIAKQNNRKIGDEKIVFSDKSEIKLNEGVLLSFLIMLRNEAHRAAITFHKSKRQKLISKSALDEIPSIGPERKKLLLRSFGSVEFIKNASIEDLKMVKGISKGIARSIFDFFNREGK